MPRAESFDVEIVTYIDELAALAGEWASMWEQDATATPFQSPEWLIPWARQFCTPFSRGQLFAVVLRRRSELAGLLPLYIFTRAEDGQRQLLLLGAGTSEYLGGVFRAHKPEPVVSAALEALMARSEMWDTATFAQLPQHSPLPALAQVRGLHSSLTQAEACWRIPSSGPEKLPQKIQNNLGYYRRRAESAGKLERAVARNEEALPVFESLVELHTGRWHESGQPGVLADPRVLAHHREAIPLLERRGIARMLSVLLDGQEIACAYCLVDSPKRPEPSLYYYLSAFDVSFRSFSPGTLMTGAVYDYAAAHGMSFFDLLRGSEPYKLLWGATATATQVIDFSSPREGRGAAAA
jgi:CelD/BcsL family acetyltransferase involved in cellulose biosynthesis